MAMIPKCWTKKVWTGLKYGVKLMENPPYPYRRQGEEPSGTKSFLIVMNIGTLVVPSLLGKKTCSTL